MKFLFVVLTSALLALGIGSVSSKSKETLSISVEQKKAKSAITQKYRVTCWYTRTCNKNPWGGGSTEDQHGWSDTTYIVDDESDASTVCPSTADDISWNLPFTFRYCPAWSLGWYTTEYYND